MMELGISESDQIRIEQARQVVVASLMKYLAMKYGDDANGAEILANDEELNMFTHEGPEIRPAEVASYTGYFLAKVSLDGHEVDVRHSPTSSTALYPLGGADNRQTRALQEDMEAALSAALPTSTSVTVRAGSLLAMDDWLLDEAYDGKDWFTPVPLDGFCYVQVSVPQGSAELADISDALSSFFGSYDAKGVYVCADIRNAEASSVTFGPSLLSQGNASEGSRLTWENSTWDPSFAERRLMGGLA